LNCDKYENAIRLRQINAEDLERIRAWLFQHNVKHGVGISHAPSHEEQIEWFKAYSLDESKKVFAIELAGEHVGNISLFDIDFENGSAMLSVFIGDPRKRGKGLGEKAICAVLALSFDELGLKRISLKVNIDNKSAIRCYEKSGFVRSAKSLVGASEVFGIESQIEMYVEKDGVHC